jgi:hypothetical protein
MPVTPAIVYRTDDALKWGNGIGRNLMPVEADENMWEIYQAFLAVSQLQPTQIASISVVGNQMTFHMDDASTFGPFTLPVTTLTFTGAWLPNHAYSVNDLFTIDSGLYIVQIAHTSDTDFNPNAGNMVGDYYALVMPFPTNFSVGFSFPGKPGTGILADEYERNAMWTYRFDRSVYFPAGLTGSVGGLFIQAASDMILPIMRDNDQIGEINIGGGQTTVTFTFVATQQFLAGDTLRVLRPETLDTTAYDLSVTFQGRLGEVS